MATFDEVLRYMQLIDDTIRSDLNIEPCSQTDVLDFSKYLLDTKQWFIHVSWAHKKQFLMSLLDDVKSIRTICLILKSIWNCRPKDAIMSTSGNKTWSGYDQVPLDHDRTALPNVCLKNVMNKDRTWFQSLKSEQKYLVLVELLSIAGGPILWEVLQRLKTEFETYKEQVAEDVQECVLVPEPVAEKKNIVAEPVKNQTSIRKSSINHVSDTKHSPLPEQVQKELDTNMTLWLSTIKALKEGMKLEQWENTYNDGTKKKFWKANRSKQEVADTVDFFQMLPSIVSKHILSYLPSNQLSDCARVNKYWAYLVEELRAEMTTRLKINVDLEKLRENILHHDKSFSFMNKTDLYTIDPTSNKPKPIKKKDTTNMTNLERLRINAINSCKRRDVTVRNMLDFKEQLDRRGAAHKNIWKLCETVFDIYKKNDNNLENLTVPLHPPLFIDPASL